MSGNKTDAPDNAGAREEKHERGLYWRRVRRRMVGATFFFLLIAMVWQLGSYSRPPAISPVAPSADSFPEIVPNETMQATDRDLRETESAFEYEELNPTFSASTEPPSAPAAAIEESAEESAEELKPEELISEEKPEQKPAEESPEKSPEKLRGETPEKLREESPEESPEKLRGETPESEVAEVAEVAEDVAPLSADDESDFFVTEPFSPFAVQIGAFKIKNRALIVARKLRADGYVVRLQRIKQGAVWLFRVRVIGYESRAAAEVARREIIAAGYSEARIRDQR